MMKPLLIILLGMAALATAAQSNDTTKYTPVNSYGYTYKRVKVDSSLILAAGDTASKAPRQIKFVGNNIFYSDNAGTWHQMGTGGGGSGGNSGIDTIYNRADSLFYKANGTEYFVYTYLTKDSGDARYPKLSGNYSNPAWINSLAWGKITGTPTTLNGYGITDAYSNSNPAGYITNSSLASYVPASRTITINGTTQDLSTNRNWSVTGLPAQTGNSGKYLTTDGTNASWGAVSGGSTAFGNIAGSVSNQANLYDTLLNRLPVFNVKNYGAIDDSLTDNTVAIQSAIQAAYNAGGGVVFFPYLLKGHYLVGGAPLSNDGNGNDVNNAQLYLPLTPYSNVQNSPTIKLLGQIAPTSYSDWTPGQHNVTKEVDIISNSTNVGGCIFGSAYSSGLWGNWNYTQLFMQDLAFIVRSKTNIGGDTVATMSGIDISNVSLNNLFDVRTSFQSYSDSSLHPMFGTFGIKGPNNNNFNATNWNNVFVQGFNVGIQVSENANIVNANINTCDTGLRIITGGHAVNIDRIIIQWCKTTVSITGPCFFSVHLLDIEDYMGSSYSIYTPDRWWNNVTDIAESYNTNSYGNIHYHFVQAYVAANENLIKTNILSPNISLNSVGSDWSFIGDRLYVPGDFIAKSNNDQINATDYSNVSFDDGSFTGVAHNYLKLPSNLRTTGTAAYIRPSVISSLHGVDFASDSGDIQIGVVNAGALKGGRMIITGDAGNFTGNMYYDAGTLSGKHIFRTGPSNADAAIIFYDGNVEYLGKLGVNLADNTEPSYPLHVNGTASIGTSYPVLIQNSALGSTLNGVDISNPNGGIQIGATNGTNLVGSRMIYSANSGVLGGNAYLDLGTTGKFILRTQNSAAEQFRIESGGQAEFQGPVGIGLGIGAIPSYQLHVLANNGGPTYASGYFDNSNVTANRLAVNHTSNTGVGFYIGGNIKYSSSVLNNGHTNPDFIISNDVRSTQPITINGDNDNISLSSLGTGTVYSNSGLLTNTNPSDRYLKHRITPVNYGLKEILQLTPVSFYYNSDSTNKLKQFGFIAQDVQNIMPDAVRKLNYNSEYLGLEKDAIYSTLVNAVKELQKEIDTLKTEKSKKYNNRHKL